MVSLSIIQVSEEFIQEHVNFIIGTLGLDVCLDGTQDGVTEGIGIDL